MHRTPSPSRRPSASALLLGSVIAACAAPAWAQTAEPEPGMWSFDGELDGRPGRSLHIDTQAGRTMAVSYLGYRTDGSSFFLQAAGTRPNTSSTFDGTLSEFRNGPVIGGGAGQGETAATAGPVKIVFDTPTTGTVTLPGDVPRRISRYTYEDPAARLGGHSIAARSYASLVAGSSDTLSIRVTKLQDGQFAMETISAWRPESRCSYSGSSQSAGAGVTSEGTYTCTAQGSAQTSGTYRAEHFVVQDDGLFRGTLWRDGQRTDLFGGCVGTVGSLGWYSLCDTRHSGMKAEPEAGIWGFEGEVNGRPGRSLQIDTQQGRAMVVTYVGYRPDGSSLFLQSSAQRAERETDFVGDLHEYRNGPVLGGGAGRGEEALNLGMMRITFDSATTGTVTLPGDTPRRIARFQYEDLTARFNQTYRALNISPNIVNAPILQLAFRARDGKFQLVRNNGEGTPGCVYTGSYRLAGRSLFSSGNFVCDSASGLTTGAYSDVRFEVDNGGHVVLYERPYAPRDIGGTCVRSSAAGYRPCSAEELNTPAP